MEVLAVQNQYPTSAHYASDWKSQFTLSTPATGRLLKSQPEYIFKATSIVTQINNKTNNNSNKSSKSNSNSNSSCNSNSNNNKSSGNHNNHYSGNRHIVPEYQHYKLKHSQQKQLQQQYQCQNQYQAQHTKHLQLTTKRNHSIFYFTKKPNTKQQQLQQQQLQNYITNATILTTNTSNSSNKLNCDKIKTAATETGTITEVAAAAATDTGTTITVAVAAVAADKAEAAAAAAATPTINTTKRTKSTVINEKKVLRRNENENVLIATAVQELSQRLLEELRAAKSRHLTCTEVHIPCDLTSRVALQILKLAHEERNGLRDCIIYIEFEDEPNNSRRIATLDLLHKYRQHSQRPIYEIYVTLRQDYPGWTALLPQFIKHLSRTITISPQFNITKHKPYCSAKSNLR